jgi:hypothetical protein
MPGKQHAQGESLKDMENRIKALEGQLRAQEKRLTTMEDIAAIERLQKAYNYYVEHMMGQEIIDCFADSPDVLLDWIEGKWLGKEGVSRYFARAARNENPSGFSHQLMPIAGLITIDPGGRTASGRWYAFGGVFMSNEGEVDAGSLTCGIYEMRYIKEAGVWKILSIKWFIPYSVRIAGGWNMPESIGKRLISGDFGPPREFSRGPVTMPVPDVPFDPGDLRYVSGYIFPHHFKHPVTGQETSEGARNARLKPLKTGK